jgi:hypothetical protein
MAIILRPSRGGDTSSFRGELEPSTLQLGPALLVNDLKQLPAADSRSANFKIPKNGTSDIAVSQPFV